MNVLIQEVNDMMSTLFQRYPALVGDEAQILCEEISAALSELVEERPEAAELLRGRTLARIFH